MAVLSRRYGLRRDSLRVHLAKHIHLTPQERDAALADSAIRAYARAQAEIPLLAAKEAERLEREKALAEDRRLFQLQQERFKALKLGYEKRERRMAEQDERMDRWGGVLDQLTDQLTALVAANGEKLWVVQEQLLALLDRGVKVSAEVRALMMDAARHANELKGDGPVVNVLTVERVASSDAGREFVGAVMAVLARHPEALREVMAMLASKTGAPALVGSAEVEP